MNSVNTVECVVIGAGVIGLAISRALAMQGREVVILESEDAIGTITSSRNSEVIHAGIYYPEGSLKAKLCVRGKELLYSYCPKYGISHKRCGKLIVATNKSQISTLDELKKNAWINGVEDMLWLNKAQVNEIEPEINSIGALLSPSTGVIDTHALMLAYLGEAEEHGAMVAYNTPVIGGTIDNNTIKLHVGGKEPTSLTCKYVFNAAGLEAQKIARSIEGFPSEHIPPTYYAKGNYFILIGKSPFKHLIYPVPDSAGLGIHLTLDLAGQARFGPDVEWIETIDYNVDSSRSALFYSAIRKYWPGIPNGSLLPGYSGVRPKLSSVGTVPSDFVIAGPDSHGVQGLVNLFGIESPGITASMAIAEEVLKKLP